MASFADRRNIEESISAQEERIDFVFFISNAKVISGGTKALSIDQFLIQYILVSLPH
jgi:hypothetical protein